MERFRITGINENGVTMNRLPVTPEEEALVRSALEQAKDILVRKALEEIINEQQQPVYTSGYRVNCAPWSGVSGRKDSVQPGVQMEQKPV